VGIETPRAAVVETLLDRGVAVFALNPKQLDRFRDRHTVGGAKDDRRDAYVLADSLRTDQPSFRAVKLSSAEFVELRELSRLRDELTAERLALGNRLSDHLNRYFPSVLQLGDVYESRWIWALLERVSAAPQTARRLSLAKIRSILQAHRIRCQTPEAVREILSQEALHVAPGVAEIFGKRVMMLLPRLRLTWEQLTEVDSRLKNLLQEVAADEGKSEHRDVALALSFPGIGTAVCAAMFGEAWQPLKERNYTTLSAICGISPITKRSGKSTVVVMRQACNQRLRNATHHWAHNAVLQDPHARAHYAALRSRGHKHARALRSVASRLLEVLLAMLRSGQPYDAAQRHRLPMSLASAAGR
jgi:transposase